MIGFEEEVIAPANNPFANRPALGGRRTDGTKPKGLNQSQNSASGRQSAKPTGKVGMAKSKILPIGSNENIKKKDKVAEAEDAMPLGSDFKKVTIEQIQAREERLKRIKDQGLIEIVFDDDNDQTKTAPSSIAEAFAAKRRTAKGEQDDHLD